MDLNFSPASFLFPDRGRSDEDGEMVQSLRAERFARKESKDTDLVLRTKDGDIVTLSRSTNKSAEFSTYSGFNKNGNSMVSENGYSMGFAYSSMYEISIEGDIDENELKDINKAINSLDKAMTKLSKGNVDEALKDALSIGSLGSVAGYEASLTYTETKEYQYAEKSSYKNVAGPEKADSKFLEKGKSLIDNLTGELADKVNQSQVPKEKVLSSVSRLFEDMKKRVDELARETEKQPLKNLFDELNKKFEDKLFVSKAEDELENQAEA